MWVCVNNFTEDNVSDPMLVIHHRGEAFGQRNS